MQGSGFGHFISGKLPFIMNSCGCCFCKTFSFDNFSLTFVKSSGVGPIRLFPDLNLSPIVPLKWIAFGIYGVLIIIYPKPYSIYFRGTITLNTYLEDCTATPEAESHK